MVFHNEAGVNSSACFHTHPVGNL